MNWKDVEEGPTWVPVLNQTELELGLPADLLARIAYEESHFRPEIISGSLSSRVGALGIMQLMPRFFDSVRVPTPFSEEDIRNQIEDAGHQMVGLHRATQDWDLAIAAYNAGLGNVEKYGGIPPFPETQKYVADITADVPSINGPGTINA